MSRNRSSVEMEARRERARLLRTVRRVRREPLWPYSPEDWTRHPPDGQPKRSGAGRPKKYPNRADRMVEARKQVTDPARRRINAKKQARTSARQAKVRVGDRTRARVEAAYRENPSAHVGEVAASLVDNLKPDGVDVSTVYRARRQRKP